MRRGSNQENEQYLSENTSPNVPYFVFSGTYNNQWMIVDYKLLELDEIPAEGVLTVLEQIPGWVKIEDQTKHLIEKTYWKSYNVAFYPEIFEKIGGLDMVDKYGSDFSHQNTSRSKIFDRDHVKIKNFDSLMKLMRYNDFENDPLSKLETCRPSANAAIAISSRQDLSPQIVSCNLPHQPNRWP